VGLAICWMIRPESLWADSPPAACGMSLGPRSLLFTRPLFSCRAAYGVNLRLRSNDCYFEHAKLYAVKGSGFVACNVPVAHNVWVFALARKLPPSLSVCGIMCSMDNLALD